MSDAETKLLFFGEDVETLSREKLILVVRILQDMLSEHQAPEARHARAVARVEMMRRGSPYS